MEAGSQEEPLYCPHRCCQGAPFDTDEDWALPGKVFGAADGPD